MSVYSGVAKDGPVEGHEFTAEHQYVDVPLPRRHPTRWENKALTDPEGHAWDRTRYVHITDHWGRGWWLWEHGWLLKLLHHHDEERRRAIAYVAG